MSLMKDVSAVSPDQIKTKEIPVKHSMIKEFTNVQTALKKSDQTDAGSTDVAAKATSDISFSLMRNTINANGEVTGSDITDYIERAEELNDEVDTVPFGLETDDGQIVKVYVNAEQADKFEEAMKNMLGLEDDIEEAINRLTTEFDIVDVVWPRDPDAEEGEEPDPDADLSIDDTSNLEDPEDDNDFAEDEYDVVASADAPPEVDPAKGAPPEDEEPEDDDTDPDAQSDDTDEDPDSDEEDEEEDPDDPDTPKKKKKKKAEPAEPASAANEQKSQETHMTIGSKFLNRVLNEAGEQEDRDGVKDGFNIPLDSQARAMAAKLKLPMAKRLVAFHYMCGVPGRYMNTAEVTDAIASSADMLRKKVAVRRAFLTLYTSLATAKGLNIPQETNEGLDEAKSDAKRLAGQDPEKIMKAKDALKKAKKELADHMKSYDGGTGARERTLKAAIAAAEAKVKKLTEEVEELTEAKQKRGSFIQKLLESVLVELGLPEELITTTGPAVVGTGIYNTAELIEQDSTLERSLRLLATRLGVSAAEAQQAVGESRAPREGGGMKPSKTETGWFILSANDKAVDGPFSSRDEAQKELDYRAEKKYSKTAEKVEYGRSGGGFHFEKKAAPGSDKVEEAVDVGNDDYAQGVAALVSALGIPDDILERRRTQVVTALREKRGTLRNRTAILTMMNRLMELLERNKVERGGANSGTGGAANGATGGGAANEAADRWPHLSALQEVKKPKLPKEKDVPIEVEGVKGMNSKPWRKVFKNQKAMEDWFEKNGEDITVHRYSTDRVGN